MADINLKLDHAGIESVLVNECAGIVAEATAAIAANVRGQSIVVNHGIPVTSKTGVTGTRSKRASGVVTVVTKYPGSGALLEAKYGVLVRSAAAAGLEVKAR